MKIISIEYERYSRRFRKPLITSQGFINDRTGWIVRIMTESDIVGYGEAADLFPHQQSKQTDSIESDRTIFSLFDEYIKDVEVAPSLGGVSELVDVYPGYIGSSLHFGIETALCDLAARSLGTSLSKWLRRETRKEVPVNYLMSRPIEDWEELKTTINSSGYKAVKIKVGTEDIDQDIDLVRMVRKSFGPKIGIRLDANRGWGYETARDILSRMRRFDVDYIEEPLRPYDSRQLSELKKETGIKIALDESLAEIDKLDKVLATGVCDVLILKPAVIGSFAKVIDVYKRATEFGCKAVITSNLETEVGIAAQLHFAAALPGELMPCGLDTLRLFRQGNPSLMQVTDGRIELPRGSGIGDGIGEVIWDNL